VVHDVTDLMKAEEALRRSHERMETLLHSLPQGILVIDEKDHRIIDANPRASLMIGAPVEKIVGRICHSFICLEEEGKCPISDLGKTIDQAEGVLQAADGGEIPILKTVLPIEIEGRKCLVETFSDISEIRRVEFERVERERLQAIVETAGAICHEINQPLMAISGYSDLLLMEAGEGDRLRPYAQMIKEQVVRVGEITKKLMTITSYKTKTYLGGKIIDIDRASKKDD
jgi:PAS domain S-box-containing protein